MRRAHALAERETYRDALVALLRRALPDQPLHVAPLQLRKGAVDPSLYRAAPVLNLDLDLERRSFWPRAGRSGVLGPRTGYTFSDRGVGYAILAPRAVEPSTPWLVRMHARHELFHASHHVRAQRSRADRELEAWIDGFTTFFAQVHTVRKKWIPLVDAYEEATEPARERAITALRTFYEDASPTVRRAARRLWLRRRKDRPRARLIGATAAFAEP